MNTDSDIKVTTSNVTIIPVCILNGTSTCSESSPSNGKSHFVSHNKANSNIDSYVCIMSLTIDDSNEATRIVLGIVFGILAAVLVAVVIMVLLAMFMRRKGKQTILSV